jgi:VCBS repeat-containing protein
LQDGDRWAIKARSFDADGTPRAAEFLVNSEIINIQVHPALTTLLDSSIVVAWATRDPLQDGIDGAIKAQIFSVTSDGANSPPVVSGNTLQTYSTLDSIPLANLFAPTDPDGRDDIVSIEISDDTPGTDGGEFGRSVFQVINGSAGWTWFPEPRIPGEPYQLTLTPAQLDDRSGPFGDYAWQYLPKTTGTNAIQIEATDSAGNVSNPLIINLNFTGATINTAPLLDLLASVSVTAGDTAIINVDATDDSDSEGSGLTYSLLASLDRNLFDIDPVSGQVSYIVPTGIADNADSNGDGIYELIAQVTDSDGLVDEKSFQIRVLKDASSASLEYLAKQVVYERNPANIVVLDNLSPEQAALRSDITEWEVEYEFIDAGGTFRAVALSKEGYAPVLAFRGTQIDDAGSPRFADGALADWAENFRSTGVGLDELNRGLDVVGTAGSQAADEPAPTLRAWILANDGLSITGHSQGGAQAQLATRFALKNDVQVAKLATFNSAGITLTQAVIDDLENTFFGTTVVHSINASDVVSLTGNAFVPGTVEYHDTDVANAFVIPNIFEGHTGYFVDDGLRTLLPFFAAPFSRSGLSLSDTQLSSGNYSPVLGYGQDWEYAGFMASVLALGGMIASAIALNPGAIQVSIGTTADSTPIIDLHASGTSLSAFLANDLLPALATREGLVNELAGANGDLVRNLLEAANQVIGAVNDGASVTINGQDVSTVLGGASAAVKAIPIADMTLNGLGLIAGSVVSIGETIQDGVLLLSSPMTNFLSGSRDGVAPTIVKDGTHANSTPAYVSNVAVNPEGEVLKSSAPGTFFALSDPSTTIEQTGGQNIVWGIPENYVDLRFVAPALGPDTFRSVAATASSGSPANAFTITDRIFVQGAAFTNADIEREKGSAILRIDFDGDGASDATVTMEGTYRLDSFVTEAAQDGTYIRYLGNAAPQVVADTATVSEDGIVLIAPLLNDLDIDGDTLAIVGLDLKGMQGTVIEDDDGTLIYDPNGAFDSLLDGETATDRFVYLVSDGTETVSSEVIITITGEGLLEPVRNPILGTVGSDNLVGTEGADAIRSLGGSYDKMLGGAAADQFIFGAEANNGIRERDVILDYEVGIDEIILRDGASVETIRVTSSQVVVFLNGDRDSIYVRGDGLTADNLTIITEDVFEFV